MGPAPRRGNTGALLSPALKELAPEAAARELSVKGIEGTVRAFALRKAVV